MKIALIIVRSLLGAMLLFASISYFFNLMKQPPVPPAVATYMAGIMSVHLMTVVKSVELICGILFVIGRFNTLAAVVIFPILINIVLFHTFLGPQDLPLVVVLLLFDLYIAFYYRDNYKTLFAAK
jgi:putative oxidoreductase